MRAALDIAIKDLRQRIRDRSAILIGIVAPLVLAVLFSVMLGGIDEDFHADWGVVDLDRGEIATALREGPIADIAEAGVISVTTFPDAAAATEAVESGTIQTAIVIPAGFSETAARGGGGSIELITDPDASISAGVARSVLQGFADRVDAVGVAVGTALFVAGELPEAARTEALAVEAAALSDPITIDVDDAADRTAPVGTYYAAAMSILFVFLGAQFGVVSLLTEKRRKTLSRMVAAPIRPASILAGKTLVSMVLAVTSMSIIVVVTALLLGAAWGDPVALATLIFAASVAATGIALLAVGFARTEDTAGGLVAIVTISLAILGGAFFPVAQAGGVLSQLSRLTPHRWYLQGVDDISTGGDVITAIGPIGVLVAIGLVTGAIGLWRARRVVVS